MKLLGQLGIDLRLLIAQAVNFLILLAILGRYLYPPIIESIEDRERKGREIEEGRQAVDEERKKADREAVAKLLRADERARAAIIDAERAAKELRRQQVAKSAEEFDKIIMQAQRKAEEQKVAYLTEARGEIYSLARDAVQRLIRGAHGATADRSLRRDLELEIERRDWSEVRDLLKTRRPGKQELSVASEYLSRRFGPLPLSDRDLEKAIASRTPEELSKVLSEASSRPISVGADDFEGLKKAVRPKALIVAAFPVAIEELERLTEALERKIGIELSFELKIDRDVLGGASIEIAGVRLDGTLAGRLKRLISARTA